MAEHINAKPILIDVFDNKGGFVYALIILDIEKAEKFHGLIPSNTFFDAETPYGYGGPCFYGNMVFDNDNIRDFQFTLKEALANEKIITQFIRFYPLMFEEGKSTLIVDDFGTYKNTIIMDLSSEDIIRSNLDSQYRRKIKKASESGVIIKHDKGENIKEFIRLYNMTMNMHSAEKMYYFKENYYRSLINEFSNHFEVFYALLDDKVVGASIFLYDKQFMHFHLGGRDVNAPSVPFENMLMVEAAIWGGEKGLKKLHLGGGLTGEDSLFQYKKKFNRSGVRPFYIGRTIIDERKYKELMNIRTNSDNGFDPQNSYYIQYRF
jgi:FemAB family.